MSTRATCLLVLLINAILVAPVGAAWDDWWKTREQQALQAYEEGDSDTLLNVAPTSGWRGLGQFKVQDYQGASQSFGEHADSLREAGDEQAANTALYNQAVSDVLSGQYQQAIDRFDQVLSRDPAFVDAEHNRAIAQQLLELQQQEKQQQDQQGDQGDQGEQGEQGDQNQGGHSGDDQSEEAEQSDSSEEQGDSDKQDQSEEQPGEQEAGNEQNQSEQSDSSQDGEQGEENASDNSPADEEQRQQDEEDARNALAAEAEEQAQQNELDAEQRAASMAEEQERPLSENEQALEQLLRRIPDDPAGLLRRKLEQSHRNKFPEVRDADEPW